ncbi:hypothetical protein [Hydrogenimonas sp.]
MKRFGLFLVPLLAIHFAVLIWVAWGLPVGPHEAKLYFTGGNTASTLMHVGKEMFPEADFLNIRIPFLLLYAINLLLFYRLSRLLLDGDDVAVATSFLIFLFLPGIVSSAILVSSTGIILMVYQAFLIFYLRGRKIEASLFLLLFLFVDKSCVIFYFALLTYALWRREIPLLVVVTLLFSASIGIYGVNIHGKPVNYFVDTIALYAAIFSPLLFLYFFYSIYRILLKGKKNIIWHISFTVLLLSLFISLRQRIPIEDFAPYVVVAIPMMVKLFYRSFRVRLPQFRKKYLYLAIVVVATLILNTLVLLFHRPLFLFFNHGERHFAAPFYLPYWCASELKREGIHKIGVRKRNLAYQFKYYGIEQGGRLRLSTKKRGDIYKIVTIRYKNRRIGTCYVSKINR